VLLVGVSLALRGLGPAVPSVERGTLWLDTVRRGPMVREVLGQGKLVPEEIRWLTAKSSAQVERVLVKPGAVVRKDTVILELANAELELAALEADRQLSQAQAELVNLEASLNAERLGQESVVATLTSDLADAERRARADAELARRGFLSELEQEQTLGREGELRGRVAFEQKRLGALSHGSSAQLSAQRAQIDRLRSIAAFRHEQVDDLKMRAGVDGVLQELALEQGQSVLAGALLAKVVQPDRLKAEVRIPETQAKDVQIGQSATIDTRNGLIAGHVARIDPAAVAGTVRVDVTLDAALPQGARPDLNVEGTIELERLASVLLMGRPTVGQPHTTASLFKLDADGSGADRTRVRLGRSSVASVEIVSGLREGDRVILSELSEWDEVDRIRLR
jgi:multidrug resistance efflux pump